MEYEFDILVFSNRNFNYVKDKIREIDADGYEHEYGTKYGLIVSSKNSLRNNYTTTKGNGFRVLKNGDDTNNVFKTQGEAMTYIKRQEELDELIGGAKYSFEIPDDIDIDYLHLGTDDSASLAIIMNNKGLITTRYF